MKPISTIIYRDIDSLFRAHPVTGALKTVTNIEAVKQGVRNTVLTNRYERLYNPTNFTNVTGTLFENVTSTTADFLRQKIRFALQVYEPRASLHDVLVTHDTSDINTLNVSVVFAIEGHLEPVVVNVFLERVR